LDLHRTLKVRYDLPLAAVKVALDVDHEDVPAPAMLNRLADVPKALFPALHLVEKNAIVNQGNCATACCTMVSSGQASAKALIYLKLRGEKSCMSGNSGADP
jgi:hypothetical protein